MARKETIVTVESDDVNNRDRGKQFKLTEMSASRAEAWAARLLLCLAHSGVDLPQSALSAGMAGVAVVGANALAGISWADAKPLLDEMFECIQIVPDPAHPTVVRRLIEDDIEEVSTRLWLRNQVLLLHTGFSFADALSRSTGTE